MADETVGSQHLVWCREALRHVAEDVGSYLRREPRRVHHAPDMASFASAHLHKISAALRKISDAVNYQVQPAVANPDATEAEIRSAVNHMQLCLADLLRGYDEVLRISPAHDEGVGLKLLQNLYRHLVLQLYRWLWSAIELLGVPGVAAEQPGATGAAEAPLRLRLHRTAETQAVRAWIKAWVEERPAAREREAERRAAKRLYRWGMALVALLVLTTGWGTGDDDCC